MLHTGTEGVTCMSLALVSAISVSKMAKLGVAGLHSVAGVAHRIFSESTTVRINVVY